MSSPLIVPRNESRTFRVCAFPSSRSLSPSTFFLSFPLPPPFYRLSNTYTGPANNGDRHRLPIPPHRRRRRPPQLLAVIVIVIVLTDGNPTFPRNPYVADERGVIPACVRI